MKILLALLMSFSFFAQAKKDGMLELDLTKSKVNWFAKKVIGDDNHKGIIPIKSAEIKLNDSGEVAGGTFVLDMTKFESTDLSGKMKAKFEGHLKSPDFFDVAKKGNETATLVIKEVAKGKAKGELTLKGVTKPITLDFSKKDNKYMGSYTLDRTKWDVKYGSNNFFKGLGDKAIDDKVKIDFEIFTAEESKKMKK